MLEISVPNAPRVTRCLPVKPPALAGYQRALALGYTRPIGEIYEAAGIRFDFSTEYLQQLADFVRGEMKGL